MNNLFEAGGIGSYLRWVVSAQCRRGHEVLLFDRLHSGSQPDRSLGNDVCFSRDDADLLRQAHAHALDVLHVHTLVEPAAEPFPLLVRTHYGHHAYCPSGPALPRAVGHALSTPLHAGRVRLGACRGPLRQHASAFYARRLPPRGTREAGVASTTLDCHQQVHAHAVASLRV